MSTKSNQEYISRINKAMNFIQKNIHKNLTLEILAKEACFSSFHFHRIFKAIVNESLYSFIKRIRLEKAANKLLNSKNSILDIALDCGFLSLSNFAFAFKKKYRLSASQYRKKPVSNNSKNSKADSNNSKIMKPDILDLYYEDLKIYRSFHMKVEVKTLPSYQVVYVRHIGSYFKVGEAWDKVCKWAGARDLINKDSLMIGISYDNPDITQEENLRYDACITIPMNVKPSGGVGLLNISGGKYAIHRFTGLSEEIATAYKGLFGQWMPDSGYQPDDRECLEIYYETPEEHPENKFVMDICVPIKPL